MKIGRKLEEYEVSELYIKHPKMFNDNPTITIKNYKEGKLLFIVLDGKRYIIYEDKDKKLEWFEAQ